MHGLSLTIKKLNKSYFGAEYPVFNDFSLEIQASSICSIIGPSGIGKTTLLNCIASLDCWTSGEIYLGSYLVPINNQTSSAIYRRLYVGIAFQQSYLLSELTIKENLLVPFYIDNSLCADNEKWIMRLLDMIGLSQFSNRKPNTLSSGQLARIGLVRALARRPNLWLLDEPTGNLDPKTADEVFSFLLNLHNDLKPTTLIVTHNLYMAKRCQRVINIQDYNKIVT